MKKVSRRALFALALAIVLAAGTLAFCVKYAVNADKWVTFSGSPHVYTGTNLTGGKIYDRTGARILNTTDGRVYIYFSLLSFDLSVSYTYLTNLSSVFAQKNKNIFVKYNYQILKRNEFLFC